MVLQTLLTNHNVEGTKVDNCSATVPAVADNGLKSRQPRLGY